MASVSRSVNTLESSTSNTLTDGAIDNASMKRADSIGAKSLAPRCACGPPPVPRFRCRQILTNDSLHQGGASEVAAVKSSGQWTKGILRPWRSENHDEVTP